MPGRPRHGPLEGAPTLAEHRAPDAREFQASKRSRVGRPTQCTVQVIETFRRCMELGLSRAEAAQIAGVRRQRVAEWERRGRQVQAFMQHTQDTPERWQELTETDFNCVCFADALASSRGDRKSTLYERMRRHSARRWRATAWLLERHYRSEFGARKPKAPTAQGETDHTDPVVRDISLEQIRAMAEQARLDVRERLGPIPRGVDSSDEVSDEAAAGPDDDE
jgi:hypothetical protein